MRTERIINKRDHIETRFSPSNPFCAGTLYQGIYIVLDRICECKSCTCGLEIAHCVETVYCPNDENEPAIILNKRFGFRDK